MIDPATIPLIITGLKESASVIRQVVLEKYREDPIEKTLQQFHNNVLGYYKEVLKLKKQKSDALKIAESMENNHIFNFYIGNEIVEKIIDGLKMVAALGSVKPEYKRSIQQQSMRTLRQHRYKLIYWILLCLEATKKVTI